MRILITGAAGQLGQHISAVLQARGISFIACDRQQLDITNSKQLTQKLTELKPDIIINCAAYTQVDLAESNRQACTAINEIAVKHLVDYCQAQQALLIHFSTDYVFDGQKDSPYTEQDSPNPINYYGASKRAGELAIQQSRCPHYILRTSWLYSNVGRNFYTTMQRLSQQSAPVKVVADQIGTPTHAKDLAEIVVKLILQLELPYGIYHYAGSQVMSWYQFAQRIFQEQGSNTPLLAISSAEYASIAQRPRYSALNSQHLSTALRYRSDPEVSPRNRMIKQRIK